MQPFYSRNLRKALVSTTAALVIGLTAVPAKAQTTVTFSYLWGGAEAQALEEIIADFNASQNDIVVDGVSSPDMTKQLASMSSARGAFDISDNFAGNVAAWADQGILLPLSDYDIDLSDFPDSVMQQVTIDDQVYSLPIASHTYQLIYNKKLLDEAGVAPPTTMAELGDAIRKLTKVDADGNVIQIGLGSPALDNSIKTLGYAFGGDWNRGGEPTPTDPGAVAAVQFFYDNVVEPIGSDAYNRFVAGFGPYMSDQDPFVTGKYAMAIDGEWRAKFNEEAGMDWGVVPVPGNTPDLTGATGVDTSTLFIPTNAPNKEAAVTFLKYLVSSPVMEKFSHVLGNLPARKSLAESSAYDDLPHFDVWLSALTNPNTQGLPAALYMAEYNADLASAFDAVVQGIQTPEAALQSVADRSSSYSK